MTLETMLGSLFRERSQEMRDAKTRVAAKWSARGGRILEIVLGLALALGPAFGQPGAPAPMPDGRAAGLPSESTAVVLAVVGTAASVLLSTRISGWPGFVFFCAGPSLGFFYGGCWGRGLLSTALRFGGTILIASALLNGEWHESHAYIWLGGMVATAVLDIVTVRAAVRRRNAAITRRRGLALDVSPFALPKGAGLRVRLAF
jgi:hypothetical protein